MSFDKVISNILILDNLQRFLNTKELLTLLQLNKETNQQVQQQLKINLINKNLINAKSKIKNNKYNEAYKLFHDNQLIISDINQTIETKDMENVQIRSEYFFNQFVGKGIKQAAYAKDFIVIQDQNNNLYIQKNNKFELLEENIQQFQCTYKLYYLKNNKLNVYINEIKQGFLNEFKVVGFLNTFLYTIIEVQINNKYELKLIKNIQNNKQGSEIKEELKKEKLNNTGIVIYDEKQQKVIDFFINDQAYKQYVIGSQAAYFLSETNQVFEYDITNKEIKESKFFKNKRIIKLFGQWQTFFAIQQEIIKPICDWTCEEIQKWLYSLNLEDYVNIVKYEKICGQMISEADQEFIIDTIGVTRKDHKDKLITEIKRNQQMTIQDQVIYGWGQNENNNIGISTNQKYIDYPQKIQIDTAKHDQSIKFIQFVKGTMVLTKLGQVYITQKYTKNNEDTLLERKNSKKGKKQKKPIKVVEQVSFSSEWLNITKLFSTTKDKQSYKILDLFPSKFGLIALCSNYDQKIQSNIGQLDRFLQEELLPKQKLTRADQIIDRIKWDQKFKQEDFSIVYIDRFVGELEVTFNEWIMNEDMKTHRIRYFKQHGKIVWDKQNKINLFKFL